MSKEQRKRGRPKLDARMIQKHVFMDPETAAMLRQLASQSGPHCCNESACMRELIRREWKRKRG